MSDSWPKYPNSDKRLAQIGDPVVFTKADLEAMNDRIYARRAAARSDQVIDIYGPKWAEKVIDTGTEIIAIHRDTGEPYPLDVHADLSVEDHCITVLARIVRAGGSVAELRRVVEAFGLESYSQRRLLRMVEEVARVTD